MKLVKNSDITLTVDGNGVPIFFEPVRSQQNGKMCFALKATNSVTFGPLRCSSPISSGLLSPESDRKDLRTFEVLLHKVARRNR